MPNLTQLRTAAREIFEESLQAMDPRVAVRRAVNLNESQLGVGDETINLGSRKVYSIAIGKAAFGMASALDEILGARLAEGVMSGNVARKNNARKVAGDQQSVMPALQRWQIFQGGHPEPNAESLAAAQAAFALLKRANEERALVIFLISGGGSAMMEWPASKSITLADLRTANQILVNCGAAIGEINSVRRAISAVKGGRLANRAPDCEQITLIVSDVPKGEDRNVASGPTLHPPPDAPKPLDVIEKYDLFRKLPETVRDVIETETKLPDPFYRTASSGEGAEDATSYVDQQPPRSHFVLLDNNSALDAAALAARRRGFLAELALDISDQPIIVGCDLLLKRLAKLALNQSGNEAGKSVCLISGGEFNCPVTGEGIGGRNLETALRLAAQQESDFPATEAFVAICAGTDGIDGNSPAAGAIIDHTTLPRARLIGLDPIDFIKRSDSYSFFVALGDAVSTGNTGTNVRDLRILLA